jgi:mannose/fructose/N-acetylgalactosamine-specific phosphotransferase system component IIC
VTGPEVAFLLGWGVLVGLDLISLPQVMIARPLVAASVAGAILGDPGAGLQVGLALELFQLDVLPVGASRYPEYGPAAIGGAAAAHLAPGVLGLGLAILTGLCIGAVGGLSIHLLRRYNIRAISRVSGALERGDRRTLVRTHLMCLARDAGRAAVVTALSLALALAAALVVPDALTLRGALLFAAAGTGVAVAAGFSGALRVTGPGAVRGLFALGVAAGVVVVVFT